jgi:magnesium transporter
MVRTRCYRDGKLHREGFAVEEVSDLLSDDAHTVWFDLSGEDARRIDTVREELGLHALAVEDVFDEGQRPKVDHYDTHLFAVMYSVEFDGATKRIRGHEVDVFLTRNAVVTVHADEGFDIDEVVRRWDETAYLAGNGVAYLMHGILDYVVDTHFDTVQQLDAEIDGLEDRLFDEHTTDASLQRSTFELRKSLVGFRRIALPMREVVNTLLRRDLEVVNTDMAPYFQDVYDHVLRVTEQTESLRDLIANILETRLTLRSNRLSVITKQVTSWAAIIAVPTAVTGFYGQNIPFPGFEQHSGFWTSSAIIVGLSGVLYFIFKRKEWL